MAKKETYAIPYIGLKKEKHTFQYQLDEKFFRKDEHSLIQQGKVDATVVFDKSIEPYILDFEFNGTVLSECDRCASEIMIPIHGTHRVFVKFDQDADVLEDENLEILFLHPDDAEIDLEVYLYDFALLSIPYTKVCKDAGLACDPDVIRHLEKPEEKKGKEENTPDPRWEGLNKLKDLK